MTYRLLAAALLLSACNAKPADNRADNAAAPAPAAAPATPAAAYADEGKDQFMSWSLTYPAEVAAIPAMADSIRAEFAKTKAENLAAAKEQRDEMVKEGYDFLGYDQSEGYEVAGQSDALLSIVGAWDMFTGGAHPNHGQTAILWDRLTDRKIAVADLFEGGAATFDKLFRDPYCTALTAERKKKREGAELSDDPEDPFNVCPKFDELAIIPTAAKSGQPITKFAFHADPYVAGPYVENDYDIDLPVTAAVIAALKPAYRASFAAR